jgi:beta-phosphoglucomutase family hydrolase
MRKSEIAVIFDMDGVIVDNDVYHFRAWGELCQNYGLKVSMDEVKSWFGNTNAMILKNLFGGSVSNEKIEKLGNEKELLYRQIYLSDIKATTGLIPFLQDLQNSGITIAIATSAPTENVDFVLEHTGTRGYFSTIIDASMISEGKPSPEIYLKAAEVLKLDVSKCLVFEDSFHGIESARRAGMKVVGVATTHPAEKLLGTVKNISDFSEIQAFQISQILNSKL